MQETWKNFLKEQTVHDNSDIDITTSPIVSPLSGFALLAVSGDDRHAFLHGQLINDLNLIEKPSAQLSAWCNPKGQVITNFIVINTGISYLLIFKEELKEFVQKRLNMFIMRSKVTIEDISESSPLVDIANIKDLSSLGSNIPTNAGEVHADDGIVFVCHPDNSGRYLITGSIDALIKKLPTLNTKFSSGSFWEILDIFAGLPWITSATQEQFLPQMLNLDLLNGLSYQKGCYPGQEVIARLHYRGEVKKRLQLIKSDNELIVGDSIYLDNAENKVGTIVNASAHLDGNYYGLAVIELDKVGDKLLSNSNSIDVLKLPYSIAK
jgi:tRNA-modifying protein YgfZ